MPPVPFYSQLKRFVRLVFLNRIEDAVDTYLKQLIKLCGLRIIDFTVASGALRCHILGCTIVIDENLRGWEVILVIARVEIVRRLIAHHYLWLLRAHVPACRVGRSPARLLRIFLTNDGRQLLLILI